MRNENARMDYDNRHRLAAVHDRRLRLVDAVFRPENRCQQPRLPHDSRLAGRGGNGGDDYPADDQKRLVTAAPDLRFL